MQSCNDALGTFTPTHILIGNVVTLAQLLHPGSYFAQIMTRHGWEEMMLNLQIQPTRKPIIEVAESDVARGDKLRGCEVLGAFIQLHAVVAHDEDEGEQDTGEELRHSHEPQTPENRVARRIRDGEHPRVVDGVADVFNNKHGGVLQEHCVHYTLRRPAEACHGEHGGKEEVLILQGGADRRGKVLQHIHVPCKEGQGVNIGINSHVLMQLIGHSVVGVVLVLPPVHREPLENIPGEVPHCAVQSAVLEHLVVTKVVGQPAGLLPEEAQHESGKKEARSLSQDR
mmetsp:Transcript_12050/g.16371  ORF Transcript_12050/g.16371 Transcript_12050/m.16371 type:complete len:284 (+) Transcript_12050:305-1156(+)